MKKIILFCLVAYTGVVFGLNAESSVIPSPASEQNNTISTTVSSMENDNYLQEFVAQTNSALVQFRKGSLLLYADVSLLKAIGEAAGAVIFGLGGWFVWSHRPFNDPGSDIVIAGCLVISAAGLSVVASRDIERKLSTTPYVVLSERGIFVWGVKVLDWNGLKDIVLEKMVITNEYGWKVDEYYTVSLNNKFGKTIASFGGKDDCLPIEANVLKELIAYYKNCVLHSTSDAK